MGVGICKPLSYLVTCETVQDAELVLFPCLHCQGQPEESWRQQWAQALGILTQVACEPTMLEAVDLQSGLQIPQNTRPIVCAVHQLISFWQ